MKSINATVWGPGMWQLIIFVADIADTAMLRNKELEKRCEQWFVTLTQALPCDPCRLFYSTMLLRFQQEKRANPGMSWVRWVCSIYEIIETKLCLRTCKQPRTHFQMLMRTHVTGHAISNSYIMTLLMLMAWRIRFEEDSDVRTDALYRNIALLGYIMRGRRPALSSALLRHWDRAVSQSCNEAFAILFFSRAQLEDSPAESFEEAVYAAKQCCETTKDWTRRHYFISQ